MLRGFYPQGYELSFLFKDLFRGFQAIEFKKANNQDAPIYLFPYQ